MGPSIDPSIAPLKHIFDPKRAPASESQPAQAIIDKLQLQPHAESGHSVETDSDKLRIPNPLAKETSEDDTRSAMTTIHYYLTPKSPLGHFHRTRGRTVHTLHKGRGRYVSLHADEVASENTLGGCGGEDRTEEEKRWNGKARMETFVVGQDVERGESLQWIVDGGKYKCSYLLPDEEGEEKSEEGLLISEVVVPGIEFADHDSLMKEKMEILVTEEQRREIEWMFEGGVEVA